MTGPHLASKKAFGSATTKIKTRITLQALKTEDWRL